MCQCINLDDDCVICISRQHDWAGLAQDVHVRPGHRYKFSAYIQLLNMPAGSLYQSAGVKMSCLDGTGTYAKEKEKLFYLFDLI